MKKFLALSLSDVFIVLINIKMPTIVDILTFFTCSMINTIVGILTIISMINTASERRKARNFFVGVLVVSAVQILCSAELSTKKVL